MPFKNMFVRLNECLAIAEWLIKHAGPCSVEYSLSEELTKLPSISLTDKLCVSALFVLYVPCSFFGIWYNLVMEDPLKKSYNCEFFVQTFGNPSPCFNILSKCFCNVLHLQ